MIKQLFEVVLAFCRRLLVEHRTGVRSKMHSTSRRGEMSGSPQSDRAPIRLTRRGRAVLVLFAATVTLICLWLTVGPGASAGGGEARTGPSKPARTVVVERGDTLWNIAADVDPGADPRVVVQRIIDLNGLGGDPTVQPGQELRLPAS
ncbi:LysM peptidoglycan-binding domain-containing protein [Actinomadura soli]|uniref:LysM peptidoglycan-binding domain-containing protein n=2 Tax=Actinomadura soli TaxID=2508997 RepID=A0A5C4J205_9ACTN|nr:LysM peptidoglycan-binding domain-containing protein [Actinomadura soli]